MDMRIVLVIIGLFLIFIIARKSKTNKDSNDMDWRKNKEMAFAQFNKYKQNNDGKLLTSAADYCRYAYNLLECDLPLDTVNHEMKELLCLFDEIEMEASRKNIKIRKWVNA